MAEQAGKFEVGIAHRREPRERGVEVFPDFVAERVELQADRPVSPLEKAAARRGERIESGCGSHRSGSQSAKHAAAVKGWVHECWLLAVATKRWATSLIAASPRIVTRVTDWRRRPDSDGNRGWPQSARREK